MLFNSIDFLLYFPVVVIVYYLLPGKGRQLWLLAASYFFYMCWNPVYASLILTSTLVTWGCSLWMEKFPEKKKFFLVSALVINLAILFFFKYFNFAADQVNAIAQKLGAAGNLVPAIHVLLPVGISFYTLQALGYAIDCYRGDIQAEHNLIRYALFISFFPQLVAGPIERSKNLLHQVKEVPLQTRRELLDPGRIRDGLVMMVWGMFLKLVISDRIAIFVDNIFDNYVIYGTSVLVLAALAFSIQIYCDFSSYSIIALGAARVLGFHLMENFKAPFFSTSFADLWRRWHISLSSWLRDYVYIPLGGNRKGLFRKNLNLIITCVVSGLWHGADWKYVAWGGLNGIAMVIESRMRPVDNYLADRFHMKRDSFGFKALRVVAVVFLFMLFVIFFRADSVMVGADYIRRMFTRPDFWILSGDQILTLGLGFQELMILLAAIMVLFAVDAIRVRKNLMLDAWLSQQTAAFRILFVIGLLFATIIFGVYGPGFDSKQFIYFQF